MRSPLRPLLALTALAFAAAPMLAAEAPKAPPMFVVHVEQAKPSMVAQYEATTKEFLSMVKENRQLIPGFAFSTLQGEDFDYAYISPIRSFADLDGITAGFMALNKALGDKWADLMRRAGPSSESFSEGVYLEMTAGSYWPANPHVTREAAKYYEVDFYRVIPGMEDQIDAVAAGWKKLYEDNKLPYGYTVYRMILGSDQPMVVVSIPAKDPVDLATSNADTQKILGAAAQAQMAKTMAITRSYEVRHYWARPDLDLAPAGK